MKIHRSNPSSHYTIIPDETLRDSRLSWQARGLLAEILSRPDDWMTSADRLWADGARRERHKRGEGRDSLRAAFAELVSADYLRRERKRGPGGRIVTELHVYDVSANRGSVDSHWSDSDKYTSSPADPAPAAETSMDQEQESLQRPEKETPQGGLSNENSLSRVTGALRRVPDATEREIEEVIRHFEADPKVNRLGPYLEGAVKRGDAADLVISARKRLAERDGMGQASGKRRKWCGKCDERTRMIGEDNPQRCPDCHAMTAVSGGD